MSDQGKRWVMEGVHVTTDGKNTTMNVKRITGDGKLQIPMSVPNEPQMIQYSNDGQRRALTNTKKIVELDPRCEVVNGQVRCRKCAMTFAQVGQANIHKCRKRWDVKRYTAFDNDMTTQILSFIEIFLMKMNEINKGCTVENSHRPNPFSKLKFLFDYHQIIRK